jgi:cell division protein FtsX
VYAGLTYGLLGLFFAVAMTVWLLFARRGRLALFTNRVRRPSSSRVAGIASVWGASYLIVALGAAQLSPRAALLAGLLEFGFIFVSAKLLALLYRLELGW